MILPLLAAASMMGGTHTLTDQPQPGIGASDPASSVAAPQVVYAPWEGPYLRVSGGFVTTKDDSTGPNGEDIDFDEGWMLSLGIGQRVGAWANGGGFSVELEGLWTEQDASTKGALQAVNDLRVVGVLADGILDYRIGERFGVYGGGGIGVAWLDPDTSDGFEDEDGPFLSWTAKAGLTWRLTPATSVLIGYRFLNVDDQNIDDSSGANPSFDLETRQHILEAGLMFGV